MKKQINTNKIVINKFVFSFALILLLFIIGRIIYLGSATNIDGINIKKFEQNRNTVKETKVAKRGTIYDSKKNILASNVSSYTVIAYLDPSRSKNSKKQQHVSDINHTAEALAPVLNMSVESLVKLLSKDLYQVELGPGGREITEIKKDEIVDLNLPGIDFVSSSKRYYPNGDFVSYVLGYAKTDEKDSQIKGEMGLELKYNKELTGTNGYSEYQKDILGYKIPNTPEINREATSGDDIYLTIDSSIQLFVEQALINLSATTNYDWVTINMMDAKTGRILATSSKPSFDPNIKDISNYLNPLTSFSFEPGSTMKTYSYMTAMEKGTYKGDDTFLSGKIEVGSDKKIISDWNDGRGWGTVTYDVGYALSSNVGVVNMLEKFINKDDLMASLKKFGFGSKTGIELPNELPGKLNFKYKIEVANAGFGQGITTTPVQHLKALTSIANDGKMITPYIVDKIVSNKDGKDKIVYQGKTVESKRVISTDTANKMRKLMYNVVNADKSVTTGSIYKLDGYELIGKTGTAQVTDLKTGLYDNDLVIKSFAGMFPYENPQVIIYAAIKGNLNSPAPLATAVKRIVEDTSKYLNIKNSVQETNTSYNIVNTPNFINKLLSEKDKYPLTYVILGNGTKIVEQYPKQGEAINNYDKVFLLTNDTNINIPQIYGYSKKDVNTICNMLNLKCNISGSGYVKEYNIKNENNEKILNVSLYKE